MPRKEHIPISIALTKVSHVSVGKYHRALRKLLNSVKPKHRETIQYRAMVQNNEGQNQEVLQQCKLQGFQVRDR